MKDLFFEDVQLGHVGRSGLYHLTKGEIIDFATHYDPRPFHIDEEAAARSVFWRPDCIQRAYPCDPSAFGILTLAVVF